MNYYYILDSYKQMRNSVLMPYEWEAVGTVHPNINEDPSWESEVLVKAKFSDLGEMDAFEAQSFVHGAGDPLETDELSDDHMLKLQRFHPFTLKQAHGAAPLSAPVWHDGNDQPIATKPHLRKMLNDHISNTYPSFRFRIFS